MLLNDYQKNAKRTAHYVEIGAPYIYPLIGLSGEVGELLNKVKKIFRDDAGKVTDSRKEARMGELGDVLWYVAQIATVSDVELADVAKKNLDKLASRQERGKITGSGDYR